MSDLDTVKNVIQAHAGETITTLPTSIPVDGRTLEEHINYVVQVVSENYVPSSTTPVDVGVTCGYASALVTACSDAFEPMYGEGSSLDAMIDEFLTTDYEIQTDVSFDALLNWATTHFRDTTVTPAIDSTRYSKWDKTVFLLYQISCAVYCAFCGDSDSVHEEVSNMAKLNVLWPTLVELHRRPSE